MPHKMPKLSKAKNKIDKDCNVKHHKLCAIAFDHCGYVYACETNRQISISSETGYSDRWTIHAEEFVVDKLRRIKARERFKKIYVLVLRWRPSTGWALAKPCKDCAKLLLNYGIDRVYFSDNQGDIKRLW